MPNAAKQLEEQAKEEQEQAKQEEDKQNKSNITFSADAEGQDDDTQDQDKSESDEAGAEESKESDGTDTKDDDDSQGKEEAGEVEFVIEDDEEGSTPSDKLPQWAKNRLKKEKSKRKKAVGDTANANAEISKLKEENDLYKRALEISQQGKPVEVKRPDHTDLAKYPDGRDSENFQDDHDSYILAKAEKKNSTVTRENSQTQDQNKAKEKYNNLLHVAKEKHYLQATKLAVPDYEETEDKVIEIFGEDLIGEIILRSESPTKLLYFLGKNLKKAEEIYEDFQTDPFGASMRLGKLEDKIKVKPKSKITPDPDKELEGGGAGTSKKPRGPKGATFT